MNSFGGIKIENGNPVLHTGISERDFAQAKLPQYLTECGYIASPEQTGEVKFSFTPWHFTETGSRKDGTILLYGEAFEGVPLSSLFESAENEKNTKNARKRLYHILCSIFSAAEQGQKQHLYLPWGGVSAVFVSENDSLLFMPATLYIRSLQSDCDELYSTECGCYQNPLLPLDDYFTFTAAILVYRFIAGKLPYEKKNTELRTIDYYDTDFIPLDFFIAESTLTAVVNLILGKKKKEDNRPSLQNLISAFNEKDTITTVQKTAAEELAKKCNVYQKKQAKKIQFKRFLRKNKHLLTVCAVCMVLLIGSTVSFIKNQAAKETTAGLSAIQTAEMFYSAYNKLNIDLMNACLKRSAGKDFVNFATNIYVTSKVRQAYEGLSETLLPEKWLELSDDRRAKRMVFGMLDFTLNGKAANAHAEFDFNRDKNVQTGTDGEMTQFTACYYFLMTQGENGVLVLKRTDTLTLEYTKNRWLITEIKSESEQISNENGEWITSKILEK